MKKIALLSMTALLAVSCSSDINMGDFAEVGQESSLNAEEQIDKLTKRVLDDIYDGNILEVADIYATFAHELQTRDNSALLYSFKNVPYLEDGSLSLDLNKIAGSFIGYQNNGKWNYNYKSDGISFGFSHYRGAELQRCEIEASSTGNSYRFSTGDNFEVLIPKAIEDRLIVEGTLASEGIITTDGPGKVTISRNMAGYNLNFSYDASSISSQATELTIDNGSEQLVKFQSSLEDSTSQSSLTIGSEGNELLIYTNEIENCNNLFDILAENIILAQGGSYDLDSLRSRIDTFNENDSIGFSYLVNGDSVLFGTVKLVLREPNEFFNYHIDVVLSYNLNGEQMLMVAPVETILTDVAYLSRMLAEITIIYISSIIEDTANFLDFVRTVIQNACIETGYRISEFLNWVDFEFGRNLEFFRNLEQYNRDFVIGLLINIDEFINNLYNFFVRV